MTDETERVTQRFVDETEQFEDETQLLETERLGTERVETELIQTERYETERPAVEEVERTQHLDSAHNPDVVETYVRFGPGVPAQAAPAPNLATAVWRGEVLPVGAAQQAAERRSRRWILPLTVLILVIAVLIYFLWGRTTNAVAVDSVAVKASTPTVTCGQTERLSAVITTNGGSGTLTYQWVRSDGTTSAVLTQNVNTGEHQASVALLWNFDGYGALDATATLHVLSPGHASGSASFHYTCSKS
ncbi:hypothetical protein [Actinospica sp.]|uniref:hypothetical protein n=1 Tax=Actinospica sp. TaxID=1872142 RepID=UPI002CE67722|nr:hypothetical protein [Actinospica sp.]HWG28558.1 hypothetical protein [Actinospica sp.]